VLSLGSYGLSSSMVEQAKYIVPGGLLEALGGSDILGLGKLLCVGF
jgi:hypothetical protein